MPQRQLLSVRVLVVDDSPDIREVIVQMLEHHGATVIQVGTAEEALHVLEASPRMYSSATSRCRGRMATGSSTVFARSCRTGAA